MRRGISDGLYYHLKIKNSGVSVSELKRYGQENIGVAIEAWAAQSGIAF